ncbi:MAG: SMP-30/gluconolactonase/LRE family protein [Verrucomicrobia bacterium]|nr:SMP-30/gluconolactonase/LRE family protein [Verrucomicrobiota bacterium]
MARSPQAELFHRVSAQLGEGPCWHPSRKTLWWIDILGQTFFETNLSGAAPRTMPCAQMIGAVAPTQTGGLVAALRDGIYLVDPDTGATTLFALAPGHDPKDFRFNDGKVDPRGCYWAGTLALKSRPKESRLYRINPDRSVAVMQEGITISNGLAWTPDARTLYYIDTPTRVVQAFDYDLDHGTIGPARIAITLAEADGWPDGCCMDAEGCLWIAHWGAAKLTRWDPAKGRLLSTVVLPVNNVTSCAFGGEKLDQLYITTAKDESRPEPEAGSLFRLDPGVPGVPVASFAGT